MLMLFLHFLKEDRLEQLSEFLNIYKILLTNKGSSTRFYRNFNILIPFYENYEDLFRFQKEKQKPFLDSMKFKMLKQ